ncbi:hypothetical protein ODJ79_16010 [Actinoplanes sp. KI2]|uniref:hypothetical protein n=1 Tax=Actinoplanes sp. KI2 TaxID=2983315 RepID=UPI0021D5B291|nr:hypothetical protein [Actinoplanes sp. KI2]MCU7725234.1 hypothetical protein [Actinoplanes sp. KI2]
MDATTATALTPAARQLGAVEARRLLRHPVYGVAVLYLAVFGVSAPFQDNGPPANAAYTVVCLDLLLVYAPVTLIAGNRIAAATYRRRVREPFDCTPVDGRQRTVAAILGLLRGPFVVGVITTLVLVLIGAFTTPSTSDPLTAVYQRSAPEYLQLPALVLGAGLLGVAVARWLPRPGALPLAALGLVLEFLLLYQFTDSMPTRTWFALWPVWVGGTQGMLPPQPAHQEMWHLTYLLGLGVLAGIAALLRTPGPRRALWMAATATTAVTVLAGMLQLRP